jgi:hypothetical protein
MIKYRRNNRGGTSSVEFGPAVFILLIVVVIPCIDILQMGLAYGLAWYFDYMALRQAACAGPTNASTEVNNLQAQWQSMGVGNFCRAAISNIAIQTNQPPDVNGDGTGDYCWVQMQVTCSPIFPLPWAGGAPVTFSFNGSRPMEEQDLK